MKFTIEEAETFLQKAFLKHGVRSDGALSVSRALVHAEAAGQVGHGFRRVISYLDQVRTGKINGAAVPTATLARPGSLIVDAKYGFAYPALDLAIERLPELARKNGIALASVFRSHHAGMMALTVERLALSGVMALIVSNASASMAAWGGRRAVFGTNPIAFATPVAGAEPLVIDMALSVVPMGKIVAAKERGQAIPEGWAFDRDGNSTTDPNSAFDGLLAPAGGAKGAALALMVEVISAALTGSNFSFEASSLFAPDGDPPNLGQAIIAIDPTAATESASARIADLLLQIVSEDGVRLPGRRSQGARKSAYDNGFDVDDVLIDKIKQAIC